jgi:Kef-type K+ transport system membrane component KefB
MRRIVILALLVGAMKLIEPLGRPDGLPEALLTFGFLILAAYASGELMAGFGLPKIVGYLVAGVAAGPGALNLVSTAGAGQLEPVSGLAIALIAFLAGAELEWKELKSSGLTLVRLTVAEVAVTFCCIVVALLVARSFIPFLAAVPWPAAIVFAALFASIAVIHSPAVTMALLTETGAKGPTARTTLGIVLISDVVVVLFFSGMLALAQRLVPVAGEPVGGVGALIWEIAGAVPIGALLGIGVAQAMRVVKDELLLFALFAALLGQQIAALLHVEILLTMLVAGFVTVNTARDGAGERIRYAMERAAAPIFVGFFALAGTKLDVVETWMVAPIVLPIVGIRILGMHWGIRLGARWAHVPYREVKQVWKGLVPQAGVAFGLVAIAADAYPQAGSGMRTLLLAMIAINQTLGPILFKRALAAAGEVARHDAGGEGPNPSPPEVAVPAV